MEVLVGLGMPEATAREQLAKGEVNLDQYWQNVTDEAVIALATHCAGLTEINLYGCRNITDEAIIALAENCEYLEDIDCHGTMVSATGRQLIQEVKARPKPPPLPEGWWLEDDDYVGPVPRGAMN